MEPLEGLLAVLVEFKSMVLMGQACEGCCNSSIVSYEASVEIAKAQEGLDSLYRGWLFPIANSLYLLRVHLHSICTNDETKVLHMGDIEFAFLDIGLQACLTEP